MNATDSETAFLASCLLDSRIFADARDDLRPGDFIDPKNQEFFYALLDAAELGIITSNGSGAPVDLTALFAFLNDTNRMEAVGGPGRIANLVERLITTVDSKYHLDKIRKASIFREMNELTAPENKMDVRTKIERIDSLHNKLIDLQGRQQQILHAYETSVTNFISNEPTPLEYILDDLLPRNIVAALIGQGGVSKTYLLTLVSICLASCEAVGPFRPARPTKVLALFAEDSRNEVHRRVHHTIKNILPNMSDHKRNLLIENLHITSVLGTIRPLMELRNGNPVRSPGFSWLEKTIEAHPGLDLLILDPKSRIYGLEENSNEHNTAFVACLEDLSLRFDLTILFSHHAAKATAATLTQHASRGGSALVDACRWVANMRPIDDKTAEKFGINARQYVEFDVTKNNYAAATPSSIFFRRQAEGVLQPVDLWSDRFKDLAETLSQTLIDHPYVSRHDLVFGTKGKDVRDQLKETGKISRQDLEGLVDYCLREGMLQTESVKTSSQGRPRTVLKARLI